MSEYVGREHIDGILEEAGMKEQALIADGKKYLADSRSMILLSREVRLLRASLRATEEALAVADKTLREVYANCGCGDDGEDCANCSRITTALSALKNKPALERNKIKGE